MTYLEEERELRRLYKATSGPRNANDRCWIVVRRVDGAMVEVAVHCMAGQITAIKRAIALDAWRVP